MVLALALHREFHPRMTTACTGTYVLLVELDGTAEIKVGSLGRLGFEAGIYAYVGSAFGPGGLASRLRRYVVGPKRKHWHIDYLLDRATARGALVSIATKRRECTWALWVRERSLISVRGFGSSDCRCDSHLFLVGDAEMGEEMVRTARYDLKATYIERRLMMARTDLVHCRNPDPKKQGINIPRWKYEAVRGAITRVLREHPGGVEFKALPLLVRKNLRNGELDRLGSVPWYTTVVKLHLETISEIERVADATPQIIRTPRPGVSVPTKKA